MKLLYIFQLINKESLQQLVLEAESLVREDIRNKTPNKSNYTKFMEIISQNSTKQNMQKDKDMKDKNKNKRVQVCLLDFKTNYYKFLL